MDDDNKQPYKNLRNEMKANSVSQADIARKLGVRPNTVSSWLNGNSAMPITYAFEVRNAFFPEMTVDYLFS